MRSSKILFSSEKPAQKEPAGLTLRFLTLDRALHLALTETQADLNQMEQEGYSRSVASLRIEARFVTIVVLAAALCECLVNTVLALVCEKTVFSGIERERTLDKWRMELPKALRCAPFVTPEAFGQLEALMALRNSIMHPKADILLSTSATESEVPHDWAKLDPVTISAYASLPKRLMNQVPSDLLPALISPGDLSDCPVLSCGRS